MYEVNLSSTTIDTAEIRVGSLANITDRGGDAMMRGLLEYFSRSITAAVERSADNCDRLIRWLPLRNVMREKTGVARHANLLLRN
jgi:hypothetical protein